MIIHIFVDAENISPKVFKESYKQLRTQHNIVKVDIFGKETTVPSTYSQYTGKIFEFIRCYYGKNSADTFMTASIIKALYNEPLVDAFVLVTQDKDFAPAIKAITEYGKQVILVTEKDKTIRILQEVGVNMRYVTNIEIPIISNKRKDKPKPVIYVKGAEQYDLTHTCFIKNGVGALLEVPFCSGMLFSVFINILPLKAVKRGFSKNTKLTSILYNSYLVVKDEKIYYDSERLVL